MIKKLHGCFCFICVLVFKLTLAYGQPGNIQFHHLTQEQGLSQSTGDAILQDSQGFMWFGTNDGLNKYDGYEMTVYKEDYSDSTTISGNSISMLFEDSHNTLWVGTTVNGLNRYNRDQDTFTRFKTDPDEPESSISNNSITDMLEDREGRLWVATEDGLNLYLPDQDKFIHIYSDSHYRDSTNTKMLSSSNITALEKGANGHIWVGTRNGLNRWDPDTGEFTRFMHDSSDPTTLSNNYVHDIEKAENGILWIGTSGGGLNRYDPEKKVFADYKNNPRNSSSISGNSVYSLLEDSRGNLWIGTENNGLNRFEVAQNRFIRYTHSVGDANSISNNAVHTLYESRDHILWVGTFIGGINYIDLREPDFEHYYHNPAYENQLSNNSVLSFLEDSNGNFWVGTDGGGLNLFDRSKKSFTTLRHDPGKQNSLASDVVLDLHEGGKNDIWIGYYNGGVSRFNPNTNTFRHYQHDKNDPGSISSDHVFVIHEDYAGNLWFGTNGWGINRLNQETGTFERFLPSATVRSMHNAADTALWVGTYGSGLIHFDPTSGHTRQISVSNSNISSDVILVIHEGANDILWLGTRKGLIRYNTLNQTFKTYTTGDGLKNNVINGILEDEHGYLWLSTNNGLSKFDIQTGDFTNFRRKDGLQSAEFNPLSYYKDDKGYMYFGGINGFNRFHPDSINISRSTPPIVLTDFQIFNKSVSVGKDSPLEKQITQTAHLELSYKSSVITFEFAALDYHEIKGNEFAYKFEGFDEDWNYVGSKRTATYTNLDPGEYTFRVKADNSDDVWSNGTELALTITPPFWRTYGFYVFTGTIVAAFLLGFYQWKVQSVRHRNEQLEKTVSERTSELKEKNRDLENALEELKKTRNKLVEKAHKAGMADLATGVLHNVGNILNSINASTTLIDETLKNSRIQNLKKANEMLSEHIDDNENFIVNNPKGKTLLEYYLKIEDPINKEYERLVTQKDRLQKKVNLIIEVIAAQQNFSKSDVITERVNMRKILEDALTLQGGSIERHGLVIKRDYENVEKVKVEKTKVMNILFNLLKNAKESMKEADVDPKILKLNCWEDEEYVYVSVTDNGKGIKKENLHKVFLHGFTTKREGHGFGLHSCANYMKEMNGKIAVDSEGPARGATFTLSFAKKWEVD